MKKHIPNALTCCNLLCGCMSIICSLNLCATAFWNLKMAVFLIFLATVFDFLDGFVARLLKVTSPIGKELDSLADCITFGVAPAMLLLEYVRFNGLYTVHSDLLLVAMGSTLLLPVFSAIRLAKFNIDTRQSEHFIGLPTPANALFIASLTMIPTHIGSFNEMILHNPFVITAICVLQSYLLISPIPLFSLKIKSLSWKKNKFQLLFIPISLTIILFLTFSAAPFILLLYILTSYLHFKKKS